VKPRIFRVYRNGWFLTWKLRRIGFFDGCPGFELGWVRIMAGSRDVTLSGLYDLGEMLHLATRPGDPVDEGGEREYEEIGFHGWQGLGSC
jgi:hypothetical protein